MTGPSLLDPRSYVDRDEHQNRLRDIVAGNLDLRVLLLIDESGQGKSDLLRRMRLNCVEDERRPGVLMVDVRDLAGEFGVLDRAFNDALNFDVFADHLVEFSRAYEDWSTTVRMELRGAVNLDASNARVGQHGILAGVLATAEPTGTDNRAAQQNMLLAFRRDLRAERDSPVVILIDHYNKAEPAVRTWIEEFLLRPCLRGDLPKIVLVIASTPDARPSYAPELAHLVEQKPLTRLDAEYARRVLEAHGFEIVNEAFFERSIANMGEGDLSVGWLIQTFGIARFGARRV